MRWSLDVPFFCDQIISLYIPLHNSQQKNPAKSMGVVHLGSFMALGKASASTLVKFQDQGLPHPCWIPSHHGVPPKIGDFWFGRCASGHRGRSLARSWNGICGNTTGQHTDHPGAVKILYYVDIFTTVSTIKLDSNFIHQQKNEVQKPIMWIFGFKKLCFLTLQSLTFQVPGWPRQPASGLINS